MIQLNLLPDVKLEYIRAERSRNVMISVSILVTVVSVVIVGILLSAGALQRKHLSDVNDDITKQTAELKNQPKINQVLTVQNQLSELTSIHSSKPAASRLFTFLNQVTPVQLSLNDFILDSAETKLSLTGDANNLSDVNQYIDTLKFTSFKSDGETQGKAFASVVLESFAFNTATSEGTKPATFTVTMSYDTAIFDNAKKVELVVPKQITTRSQVTQSNDLLQGEGTQ